MWIWITMWIMDISWWNGNQMTPSSVVEVWWRRKSVKSAGRPKMAGASGYRGRPRNAVSDPGNMVEGPSRDLRPSKVCFQLVFSCIFHHKCACMFLFCKNRDCDHGWICNYYKIQRKDIPIPSTQGRTGMLKKSIISLKSLDVPRWSEVNENKISTVLPNSMQPTSQ